MSTAKRIPDVRDTLPRAGRYTRSIARDERAGIIVWHEVDGERHQRNLGRFWACLRCQHVEPIDTSCVLRDDLPAYLDAFMRPHACSPAARYDDLLQLAELVDSGSVVLR